ncbi:MAG: DUF1573 domain-containing protein, partial [Planctomycetota bacterium]
MRAFTTSRLWFVAVLAVVIGSWIGATRKPRLPAGYEPTEVAGLFAKQHVIDVGMVSLGSVLERTFELLNAGNEHLQIADYKTTCGCLAVDVREGSIIPTGAEQPILVRVNVSGTSDTKFRHAVVLEFVNRNEEDLGNVLLFVKGLVDRSGEVRCWPTGLDFGEVVPGEEMRKTVYFCAAEPVLANLPKTVRVSGQDQRVLQIPLPVSPKPGPTVLRSMDIVLKVPEAASEGRFNSSIKVAFSLPTPREVMLRVHADVCPGVAIEPGSLYFAVPQDGSVTTAEIRVRSVRRQRPFRIQRVSADVPLVCEIVDCNSLGGLIRVQSKPSSVLSRPLHGHLTLDLAEDGLQRVPVVL